MADSTSLAPATVRAMISYRQQERDLLSKQRPGATKHSEGHVGPQRTEEIDERIKTLDAEIAELKSYLPIK